jgi:hypothetical protein
MTGVFPSPWYNVLENIKRHKAKQGGLMSFELLAVGILVLVIGIALCFAGYRAFRGLIAVWGFFAGFLFTIQAVGAYSEGHLQVSVLEWVIALIVGLLLAALAYQLYVAAVVILSASVGFWIGTGLMMAIGYGNHSMPALLVGLIFAVVIAILTLSLNVAKILIIISTSLGGASTIIAGILLLLGSISLNDAMSWDSVEAAIRGSLLWSLVWLVLVVAGIITQLNGTRRYERGYAQAQFYKSGRKPIKS